jgi:hypothetical protein
MPWQYTSVTTHNLSPNKKIISYIFILNKAIFPDPYDTYGVIQVIQKKIYVPIILKGISDNSSFYSQTANQLPNSKTRNSSFFFTAAFPTQQLSLHSQPATAQTNRPLVYWHLAL